MTASITLTADTTAALAGLVRLRERAVHLQPVLDRVGAALESSTIERFDAGVSPAGAPWKPSNRAVAGSRVEVGRKRKDGSRKVVMGRIGKTLVDSARLRNSITHSADDTSVDVGSNVVYAAVHQFGATITAKGGGALRFRLASGDFVTVKSVTIPARPYLGISPADELTIIDIVSDALAEAAAGGA